MESLLGMAVKEKEKGRGPLPDMRVSLFNQQFVTTALAAFFKEQGRDGLWDTGQPIYKSFSGGAGQNMGNAFVFPVNMVGSLLCLLLAEHFQILPRTSFGLFCNAMKFPTMNSVNYWPIVPRVTCYCLMSYASPTVC